MLDAAQELWMILGGVSNTLAISLFSLLIGLAIGLPLAFVRIYEKDIGYLVEIFEKIFRGIPELVLMLLFFFGVGYYFPFPFKNPFFTAIFVLGLRSAANQSQIFRCAIHGVGEEQMIAARSIGLSRLKSIRHVMVPQVFVYSTPGLGSEYALLVKDSSYVFVLGVLDILFQANAVKAISYDIVTPYVIAGILYILLTFPIATYLDMWGSKRKKKLGL